MNENIKNILSTYGQKIVTDIALQLRLQRSVASGKLIQSLAFNVTDVIGEISLIIEGDETFKFIDKGRKPNSRMPNISKLQKWVLLKGIQKKAVYPIAKSIAKKGIQPKNTLRQVLGKNPTESLSGELINEWRKDIEEQIQQIINQK